MSEKPDMELTVTFDNVTVAFDRKAATFFAPGGGQFDMSIRDMKELQTVIDSWAHWRDKLDEEKNPW